MCAVLTFIVLAVWGVASAHGSARGTVDERADRIAAQLRCPVCNGESVAQSQSETARAMLVTIRTQLESGRTPGQVRQWFVDRYGSTVLLRPPAHGIGLIVYGLPAIAAIMAAAALAARIRRRPPRATAA